MTDFTVDWKPRSTSAKLKRAQAALLPGEDVWFLGSCTSSKPDSSEIALTPLRVVALRLVLSATLTPGAGSGGLVSLEIAFEARYDQISSLASDAKGRKVRVVCNDGRSILFRMVPRPDQVKLEEYFQRGQSIPPPLTLLEGAASQIAAAEAAAEVAAEAAAAAAAEDAAKVRRVRRNIIGLHRDTSFWREVYTGALSNLLVALVIYLVAATSGLVSTKPLIVLTLMVTVGFFSHLLYSLRQLRKARLEGKRIFLDTDKQVWRGTTVDKIWDNVLLSAGFVTVLTMTLFNGQNIVNLLSDWWSIMTHLAAKSYSAI